MSLEYDRLVADVATNCPGVIPATADAELMLVLRDFLQHTSAWKLDLEMPVFNDRTCYVLVPPADTQIYLLFRVFQASDPDQRTIAQAGWRMTKPGHIEFIAPPPANDLWVATVSLFPVTCCEGGGTPVPSHILTEYYDTLLHGILARLQTQLMKSYTNPQMALLHNRLYREGRAIAKAEIARGHVWGTQQWRFPGATTATVRQAGA